MGSRITCHAIGTVSSRLGTACEKNPLITNGEQAGDFPQRLHVPIRWPGRVGRRKHPDPAMSCATRDNPSHARHEVPRVPAAKVPKNFRRIDQSGPNNETCKLARRNLRAPGHFPCFVAKPSPLTGTVNSPPGCAAVSSNATGVGGIDNIECRGHHRMPAFAWCANRWHGDPARNNQTGPMRSAKTTPYF